VRTLRADILLVYEILFGLVHVNAFFVLRNKPHLWGHKYVMVKQRSVGGIGESFFSVTERLIYGSIYQFVQILQVSVSLVDY